MDGCYETPCGSPLEPPAPVEPPVPVKPLPPDEVLGLHGRCEEVLVFGCSDKLLGSPGVDEPYEVDVPVGCVCSGTRAPASFTSHAIWGLCACFRPRKGGETCRWRQSFSAGNSAGNGQASLQICAAVQGQGKFSKNLSTRNRCRVQNR